MPPETPTGDGGSIRERVDDFVDKYNDWTGFSASDGVMIAENSHVSRKNVFLDGVVHDLSLSELREFPRYLCDVSLRAKNFVVTAEHYSYWSWTLAFVQYLRRNSNVFEKITNPYHPDPAPSPGSANLINDMFLMHRLLNLPLRMSAPYPNPSVENYIQNSLRLTNDISEIDTLRLFSPVSLALLDGLVCRHCSRFLTIDGRLENPPVSSPWSSNHSSKSGVGYHDRLQLWRYHVANPTTNDTLAQVDDISRYESKHLKSLSGVIDSDEDIGEMDHFLQILSNQRHYNVHGEGSSVSILPITFSLCCLIFWDAIEQSDFDKYRSKFVDEVRAAVPGNPRQSEYTDYYPIFRWEVVSLMQLCPSSD
ncbi:hypothetical protein V5735_08790 (plasmid) [Haladaptatus sp. SPP-AMP-3]|uniref:hypothetical protein n=1 Tax=Haladaptatus sp. SPP-AMP-3 TaxID=3121295 RepID=UPI003C2C9286